MSVTIEQALELIEELNELAHDGTWDQWIDAGDDEELREEASDAQRGWFYDELHDLPEDQIKAIFKYAREDDDFREQFECYYGPLDDDEFEAEE